MKVLKFSKDYDKLKYPIFPTWRRYQKHKKFDIVKVVSPLLSFNAIIVHVIKERFTDISIDLLLLDTAPYTKNLGEIISLFNSFYQNSIDPYEVLTCYYLVKLTDKGAFK